MTCVDVELSNPLQRQVNIYLKNVKHHHIVQVYSSNRQSFCNEASETLLLFRFFIVVVVVAFNRFSKHVEFLIIYAFILKVQRH